MTLFQGETVHKNVLEKKTSRDRRGGTNNKNKESRLSSWDLQKLEIKKDPAHAQSSQGLCMGVTEAMM